MPDDQKVSPPGAESDKAQKYVESLIKLIDADKVSVSQTDLSRFNSPGMEDHYRINLQDYDIELSHNRNLETKEETFVMIFNGLNRVDSSSTKPVILAYVHLESEHFLKLKQSCDAQLEKIRKAAEEKRFSETMQPIDSLLEQMSQGPNLQPVSSYSEPQPEEISQPAVESTTPAEPTETSGPIPAEPVPPVENPTAENSAPENRATPAVNSSDNNSVNF